MNWTSATTKNHIYFNGQLIATHDQADSVRMLFKDNLGSTRSVAKVFLPTGSESWGTTWQVVEVHDWELYGNLYSAYGDDPADRVTQKFTGQKRDTETNLDYFGARYYDPGVGASPGNPRWISPDPVMNRPEDPPSLNKYTYARTDPINLIDPDGKDPGLRCAGNWQYLGFGQWACVSSTGMSRGTDPDPFLVEDGSDEEGGGGSSDDPEAAWWGEFWKSLGKTLLHGTAMDGETFDDCMKRNLRMLGISPEKVMDETKQLILKVSAIITAADLARPRNSNLSSLNYMINVLARDFGKIILGQPPGAVTSEMIAAAHVLKYGALLAEVAFSAAVGVGVDLTINCREAIGR